MKLFNKAILIATILFSSALFITSCSNETESVNENNEVSAYLKSFYKTSFELGRSVTTKNTVVDNSLARTTEVDDIILTEVFVGDDTRARGYILTDKSTNDLLYFIDVNRIDLVLTSAKIDVNETMIFNNIDDLDKYLTTDELDYIKIADDYNLAEQSARGKFWGWGPPVLSNDCVNGQRAWVQFYYVLGVNTGSSRAVKDLSGEPLFAPCE